MKKYILLAILPLLFTGCLFDTDARLASANLSKAADMFQVNRRIIFYNGITSEYILTIEGFCSIKDQGNQLEVTCKIGDTYKKHFLGLSDNVTYFAEQISSENVSTSFYKVIFKPTAIIPDVDVSM